MVKHVPRLFFFLLALALLVVAGCMAWISYIPRDVGFLIPRVEASLNADNPNIQISIKEARIDWRRWNNFGRIFLSDIALESKQGKVFAEFPSVQVKFSPAMLLLGNTKLDWVMIPRTDLVLTSTPDRKLMLGFSSEENSIPISSLYASSESEATSSGVTLPFNHLLLEDAKITIRDEQGKVLLRTYDSDLAFNRESQGFQGAFRLNFSYRDQVGSVNALVRYNRSAQDVSVASKLMNVPIGLICGAVGDCGPFIGLRGAVTGTLSARMIEGVLSEAECVMMGKRLRFSNTEWFPETLNFESAAINATISDNLQSVNVTTVDFKNDEVHLLASGKAHKKADGWYIDGVVKQNNLKLSNLYKYWPSILAPNAREWVTGSITQGYSPEAVAAVSLTPPDLEAEILPDSFLKATVQARDLTMEYLPGLAPVKGVDGIVHFTGNTMKADVGGGALLTSSKLKQANVFFSDLNHPNVPVRTVVNLDASAGDAAEIFTHKAFTFDDALKLDTKALSGRLTSKLDLQFNAYSNPNESSDTKKSKDAFDLSAITYSIEATLAGIGQKKLMGAYDVENINGTLEANNDGLSIDGKGNMAGAAIDVSVNQKSGSDVHVKAKGAMTKASMEALGLPKRKELGEGTIGFDATFMMTKSATVIESLALNLTDVALNILDISWSKPKGAPSLLSLTPVVNQLGNFKLSHTGSDLSLNGTLTLDSKTSELKSLSISRLKTPRNDFALNYEKQGDVIHLKLTGDRFDNSASFTSKTEPDGENSILANFPKLFLILDVGELTLAPDHPFRNLKGSLDCSAGPCVSADISARVGQEKSFNAIIKNTAGNRTLEITSEDAGGLLNALDITDKVYGGNLDFKGAYSANDLKGRLIIKQFNVKQSQILARLFSVASLSGMSNLLTGSGIDFSKLQGDVAHSKGIFTFANARANGASVGYTTEGTINTTNATLNLKGVLVPAYMFNSIVGQIPVIGAIAGGEGEGLFSFTYTIKGNYADPEVSVNPLSGLTPGFLRGIFDGESVPPSDNKKGPSSPVRERR